MNKTMYGLALVTALATAGCSQQGDQAGTDTDAVALETTEERLSYGIAYGLGQRLEADGVPLDVAAFNLGMQHGFEGAEQLLSDEEIGAEMQAYQERQAEARALEAESAAVDNAAAGAAFLAENGAREGVVTLESGLQYEIISAGDGPKPGPDDTVEVHYRGTLIDGTEFDSSYARGSTVSFVLNQVIPGWTEALQLMPAGSKWKLFIPPELAYGAGGAGPTIGPNSTLVFDVELLQIAPVGES